MIRRIVNRWRYEIRCSSLIFRQRHRLMWCVFCSTRIPRELYGGLSVVERPSRTQVLAWTCLPCWNAEGGSRAAT